MKTKMKQTSINAYTDLKEDFTLGNMQQKVLDVMKQNQLYTRRELSNLTSMETSSIAGRVNELLQYGVLEVNEKVVCPYSKKMVESVVKVVK
jgi:predicted HTH transcriptional regulator